MESGLIVRAETPSQLEEIIEMLSTSDFYFEVGDNHLFFPEEPASYDALEDDLKLIFDEFNYSVTFEGV